MIVPDSIAIENFLSFGPAQELKLGSQGLVLVEGRNLDDPIASSNGAGKSALVEALTWVRFGKTLRKLVGDDVINRHVGKDCQVTEWGHKDALPYVIRRYRKHLGSSGLYFEVDGVKLSANLSTKETQILIELYLGMTYEVFVNAVIFGQGNQWRFTGLTDNARKDLFDRLLGVTVISQAQALATQYAWGVKVEADNLQNSVVILQDTIRRGKAQIKDMRIQHKRHLRQNRSEAKECLADLKGVSVKRLEGEYVDCEVAAEGARKEKRLCEDDLLQLDRAYKDDIHNKSKLKAERVSLEETFSELETLSDETCRLCGSTVSPDKRAEYIKQLRSEYEECALAISLLQRNMDAHRPTELKLKESIRQAQVAIDVAEKRQGEIRRELVEAAKLDAFRKAARKQIRKLRAELAAIKAGGLVPNEQSVHDQMNEARTALRETQRDLKKARRKQQYYDFWKEGFGPTGIKSHLLDHVVPRLNKRAAQYSRHLMGGLSVQFDTQTKLKSGELRDRFDVVVTNSAGANGYDGSSGGERRKVDIVVARALQSIESDRLGVSSGMSWWDEVYESLDESSCEAVMEMLRDEVERKSSVFVISHLEWLKPHFPRVLTVVKEDGFSRLEWS